jgi:predicted membrane chloride channel (bestrophin family)
VILNVRLQCRDPVFASTLFAGLSESVDVLTGATGAMERINGTPLPVCYAGHMRIFLLLYLSMLPVVLVERWGEEKQGVSFLIPKHS